MAPLNDTDESIIQTQRVGYFTKLISFPQKVNGMGRNKERKTEKT